LRFATISLGLTNTRADLAKRVSPFRIRRERLPRFFARIFILLPALDPRVDPPMEWTSLIVDRLSQCQEWRYGPSSPASSEPAAFVSLALLASDRTEQGLVGLRWLAGIQTEGGTVGITHSQSSPCWPTSLAVIGWDYYVRRTGDSIFRDNVVRAREWLLSKKGHTQPRPKNVGHDTTLLGWPWVGETHAWLEPTAFALLALRLSGMQAHPRAQEAISLILDRQLPGGGCNYGNTTVLGQQLLAHVQPSGLAMLALAGRSSPRISKSIAFLRRKWSNIGSTNSLCFAAMGLAAHGATPADLSSRLESAFQQTPEANHYSRALLVLASLDQSCPLIFRHEAIPA